MGALRGAAAVTSLSPPHLPVPSQVVSIITDEPAPEQLRGRGLKEAKRPRGCRAKLALLQEVFGRGCVLGWLFPCSCGTPAGPAYAPLPACDV